MREKNKVFKNGTYTFGITVALLVIIVVANLLVSSLPNKFTKIDVSSTNLYQLTDTSKTFLKELDQDITLTLVCKTGNEDPLIQTLLDNYKSTSSHIKISSVDQVLHPATVEEYSDGASVQDNSIIVESGKRFKIVNITDMYYYETDSNNEKTLSGFDAEGQITAAIDYVTTEDLPVVYQLRSYGETAVYTNLVADISKLNINLKPLDLQISEGIPADAEAIIINNPTSDYTEQDAQKVIDYLKAGGDAYIVTGYKSSQLKNFMSILEAYGVTVEDGKIVEGNTNNYYPNSPYIILPNMESHAITDPVQKEQYYVLAPEAQGIKVLSDIRSTLEITPLLVTSDSAYLKGIGATNRDKQLGDLEGPFNVAVAIKETYNNEDTNVVVLSCSAAISETVGQFINGGNIPFHTQVVSYLCDQEANISIPYKSMYPESLSLTQRQVSFWTVVIAAIIPAAVLIAGICVWLARRKR